MSIRTVTHVARNVFKESVRDKVLYSIVAFAVILIATSYLLGQLTAGQDIKIIKDLGLAAIATFGLLIAIFIGIGLVWKEVERRSIYSLLAKPIRRSEFVIGKYCGLALTLAVNIAVMTAAYYVVLAYMGWSADASLRASWPAPAHDPALLKAIVLIGVELMLVTGIALFFSTFSSPFLSAVLTFGLWVIGHFNTDLRNFEAVVESRAAAWLARSLYYLLPNFSAFDIKAQVVHAQPVPLSYVGLTALYGGVYVALVLVGAVAIFSRRDFK
jgi:ABC-type transport system involved in multi-copper enzyme maturation permease subunit